MENIHASSLMITSGAKKYVLPIADIVRLEAKGNYTIIYSLQQPPFVVAKVLGEYELFLTKMGFVRTHRSHLVNRHYVLTITVNGTVILDNNVRIPISRRKKIEIRALLGRKGYR